MMLKQILMILIGLGLGASLLASTLKELDQHVSNQYWRVFELQNKGEWFFYALPQDKSGLKVLFEKIGEISQAAELEHALFIEKIDTYQGDNSDRVFELYQREAIYIDALRHHYQLIDEVMSEHVIE